MPPILGQVDLIEDGYVKGWICQKGNQGLSLEVKFFVNDILVGNTSGEGRAAHSLVDRICAGPANIGTSEERNVAFAFKLPTLNEGLYNVGDLFD